MEYIFISKKKKGENGRNERELSDGIKSFMNNFSHTFSVFIVMNLTFMLKTLKEFIECAVILFFSRVESRFLNILTNSNF
jgi:hypothetical protein